jgi:hypothetical protein
VDLKQMMIELEVRASPIIAKQVMNTASVEIPSHGAISAADT